MYEISERTIEVLSLALHDLCANPKTGAAALKELARLIRFHGGLPIRATIDDQTPAQIELGNMPTLTSPVESHAQDQSLLIDLASVDVFEQQAPVIDRASDCVVDTRTSDTADVAVENSRNPREIDIIFVIGGPGSGKGTICARLAEDHHFMHVSVGDILRSEVQSGSELGIQVADIMRDGSLVSDGLILDVVQRYLDTLPLPSSETLRVLMDGFPRTVEQATEFEKLIRRPSKILWFSCEDSILIERILSRGETSGRADDNEESANQRLRSFHDCTDKIHEYFSLNSADSLISIDASQTIDEVYNNITKALSL
jgi:adenylate kinase family enzyme